MNTHMLNDLIAMYLLTGIDQRTLDNPEFERVPISERWIDQGHLEMAMLLNDSVSPIISKEYVKFTKAYPEAEFPLSHLLYIVCEQTVAAFIVNELPNLDRIKDYVTFLFDNCQTVDRVPVISRVDYFDIKAGDAVQVLSRHEAGNEACDYIKCVLPDSDKVHYLFTAEFYSVQ